MRGLSFAVVSQIRVSRTELHFYVKLQHPPTWGGWGYLNNVKRRSRPLWLRELDATDPHSTAKRGLSARLGQGTSCWVANARSSAAEL